MANVPGTKVLSQIVPTDSADTYPTHLAQYGKGGWKSMTYSQMQTIPSARREEGMAVYATDVKKLYILEGGISNTNWVEKALDVTQWQVI